MCVDCMRVAEFVYRRRRVAAKHRKKEWHCACTLTFLYPSCCLFLRKRSSHLRWIWPRLGVSRNVIRMKVIVLGAGVIGVPSAWYLAKAGHEVTVIERQPA